MRHEWRVWIATRPEVLDDKTLRLFACLCVRQVSHLLDERGRNALGVAELFAIGKATLAELHAARAAAMDAVREAISAQSAARAAECAPQNNAQHTAQTAAIAAQNIAMDAERIAAARAAACAAGNIDATWQTSRFSAVAAGWNAALVASYGDAHYAAITAQAVWLIENAAPNFEIA
jgi:hypothetical protein